MFSSLCINTYPSTMALGTWGLRMNLPLPVKLTSCYIGGNRFRISWIGVHSTWIYYSRFKTHSCLLMLFRQKTTLFKATKENAGNSPRCALVPDSILPDTSWSPPNIYHKIKSNVSIANLPNDISELPLTLQAEEEPSPFPCTLSHHLWFRTGMAFPHSNVNNNICLPHGHDSGVKTGFIKPFKVLGE